VYCTYHERKLQRYTYTGEPIFTWVELGHRCYAYVWTILFVIRSVTHMCRPPRRLAASPRARTSWSAYASRYFTVHNIVCRAHARILSTSPKIYSPPRWVAAGRPPAKWVTVSPAETGSPRAGGAPGNRITGSPGGRGGCPSVRGRFRGWTVRAQPLAAAIIDPFRRDLVRRRRVWYTWPYIARGVKIPRLRIYCGYCGRDEYTTVPCYTCFLSVLFFCFALGHLYYANTMI